LRPGCAWGGTYTPELVDEFCGAAGSREDEWFVEPDRLVACEGRRNVCVAPLVRRALVSGIRMSVMAAARDGINMTKLSSVFPSDGSNNMSHVA
jgi:hypothetical protein